MRLPTGSFTMDRHGRIIVSTLPSGFPEEVLHDIGRSVMDTFAEARKAGLYLDKLILQFGSLKVSARDMSGGAMVFFSPITPISINSIN
jgi:hypothetical protein